jgi:hypothetical protein
MDRRRFVAGLAAGASATLAGCLGGLRSLRSDGDGSDPARSPTTGIDAAGATDTTARERAADGGVAGATTERDASLARHGFPPTICEEEIQADPGIYAIVEPAFAADWSGVEVDRQYRGDDRGLADDRTVIGIEAPGAASSGTDARERARAYPLSVLTVHEIVNDSFGPPPTARRTEPADGVGEPKPVLVTYCPLCSSGLVAERRAGGATTRFGVTGLLWKAPRIHEAASEKAGRAFGAEYRNGSTVSIRNNGNLVMYDAATRSYWSQVLGRAICGPLTGDRLPILPSTVATWGEWRAAHPDGEVLLPPPHSGLMDHPW